MKDNNQQMTMERQFQPMSAAQLKEQVLRARMIDDASTPDEKERLRREFNEWNKQGKPITEGIAERARKMREAWQSELWSRIVGGIRHWMYLMSPFVCKMSCKVGLTLRQFGI